MIRPRPPRIRKPRTRQLLRRKRKQMLTRRLKRRQQLRRSCSRQSKRGSRQSKPQLQQSVLKKMRYVQLLMPSAMQRGMCRNQQGMHARWRGQPRRRH